MHIRFSGDLQFRVVSAVQRDGLSGRAASGRFRVSASMAVRWRPRSGGNRLALALAKLESGERRRAKGRVGSLYERVLVPCGMSMKEAREWLAERGHVPGTGEARRPRRGAERGSKGCCVGLRVRVAAILAGVTGRAASERFGV